jgi:hypothetical protein
MAWSFVPSRCLKSGDKTQRLLLLAIFIEIVSDVLETTRTCVVVHQEVGSLVDYWLESMAFYPLRLLAVHWQLILFLLLLFPSPVLPLRR